MRFLHFLNGVMWLANALVWAFYAHSPVMAVASLAAAFIGFFLSRSEA